MSNKAILEFNGKKYEFPVYTGTENEVAMDISVLRSVTEGLITLDVGYKNTGSCSSKITFLDGEKGILRHRGYSIEDLTKKACFLEVAFLIIFGELPTKEEFEKFKVDIKKNSMVNEEMKDIVEGFPKSTHPM
ncbi:MAG: citrate/2-methylcitrate synthase, partial [Lutibacter sp.]|nr:citrate/2-methylcitrate synthase [Lutibacter sp.]